MTQWFEQKPLIWAAVVGVLLVLAGIAISGRPAMNIDKPNGDAFWYASMVGHDWPYESNDPSDLRPTTFGPYSAHSVQAPWRYRVLVPFIASLLPFRPMVSLAVVTYLSMAGAYTLILLSCRRLGLPMLASVLGLVVASLFSSPLFPYHNPYLIDAFGLLCVAGMTYAFVIDRFWLFVFWGLLGTMARENIGVMLPLWIFRSVPRAIGLLAVAGAAIYALHTVMYAPNDPWSVSEHMWLTLADRKLHPRDYVMDIVTFWGWGPAFALAGYLLRPALITRTWPVVLAAVGCAVATSLVTTDTIRYFCVILPGVAIGCTAVLANWIESRRIVLLAALAVVGVVQFVVSWPNVFIDNATWQTLAWRIPILKIGIAWIGAVAIALWMQWRSPAPANVGA